MKLQGHPVCDSPGKKLQRIEFSREGPLRITNPAHQTIFQIEKTVFPFPFPLPFLGPENSSYRNPSRIQTAIRLPGAETKTPAKTVAKRGKRRWMEWRLEEEITHAAIRGLPIWRMFEGRLAGRRPHLAGMKDWVPSRIN